MSIYFHLFSPASRGLFHSAVISSGSVSSVIFQDKEDALKGGRWMVEGFLGCKSERKEEERRCLRRIDPRGFVIPSDALEKRKFFGKVEGDSESIPFGRVRGAQVEDLSFWSSPLFPQVPAGFTVDGTTSGLPLHPQRLIEQVMRRVKGEKEGGGQGGDRRLSVLEGGDSVDFSVKILLAGVKDEGNLFTVVSPSVLPSLQFPHSPGDTFKMLKHIFSDQEKAEKALKMYGWPKRADARQEFMRMGELLRDSIFQCSTLTFAHFFSFFGGDIYLTMLSENLLPEFIHPLPLGIKKQEDFDDEYLQRVPKIDEKYQQNPEKYLKNARKIKKKGAPKLPEVPKIGDIGSFHTGDRPLVFADFSKFCKQASEYLYLISQGQLAIGDKVLYDLQMSDFWGLKGGSGERERREGRGEVEGKEGARRRLISVEEASPVVGELQGFALSALQFPSHYEKMVRLSRVLGDLYFSLLLARKKGKDVEKSNKNDGKLGCLPPPFHPSNPSYLRITAAQSEVLKIFPNAKTEEFPEISKCQFLDENIKFYDFVERYYGEELPSPLPSSPPSSSFSDGGKGGKEEEEEGGLGQEGLLPNRATGLRREGFSIFFGFLLAFIVFL